MTRTHTNQRVSAHSPPLYYCGITVDALLFQDTIAFLPTGPVSGGKPRARGKELSVAFPQREKRWPRTGSLVNLHIHSKEFAQDAESAICQI